MSYVFALQTQGPELNPQNAPHKSQSCWHRPTSNISAGEAGTGRALRFAHLIATHQREILSQMNC